MVNIITDRGCPLVHAISTWHCNREQLLVQPWIAKRNGSMPSSTMSKLGMETESFWKCIVASEELLQTKWCIHVSTFSKQLKDCDIICRKTGQYNGRSHVDFQKTTWMNPNGANLQQFNQIKCISTEGYFINQVFLKKYLLCNHYFELVIKIHKNIPITPFRHVLW